VTVVAVAVVAVVALGDIPKISLRGVM